MRLFKKVNDLQKYLNSLRLKGLQIGFAPTMGALHNGHIALINQTKTECDVAVASIFVNPTQFNDPKDLAKYPRTPEKDIELLAENGCNILFMPDVEEIYPTQQDPSVSNSKKAKHAFNFGKLDKVLEGEFRPGHFDGMAQVVHRLLDIVQPDRLYMGQKDFQQLSIVASMLGQMNTKTQLVMCPTIREKDGLAMSSRNVRLSLDDRSIAPFIYQVLQAAADMVADYSPAEIQRESVTKLRKEPRFKLEYFEIVDGRTLMPIRTFEDTDFVVAVTAIWVGDVRLIDNIILKKYHPQEEVDTEG
jgi:pantoate--beta-alanine ligase